MNKSTFSHHLLFISISLCFAVSAQYYDPKDTHEAGDLWQAFFYEITGSDVFRVHADPMVLGVFYGYFLKNSTSGFRPFPTKTYGSSYLESGVAVFQHRLVPMTQTFPSNYAPLSAFFDQFAFGSRVPFTQLYDIVLSKLIPGNEPYLKASAYAMLLDPALFHPREGPPSRGFFTLMSLLYDVGCFCKLAPKVSDLDTLIWEIRNTLKVAEPLLPRIAIQRPMGNNPANMTAVVEGQLLFLEDPSLFAPTVNLARQVAEFHQCLNTIPQFCDFSAPVKKATISQWRRFLVNARQELVQLVYELLRMPLVSEQMNRFTIRATTLRSFPAGIHCNPLYPRHGEICFSPGHSLNVSLTLRLKPASFFGTHKILHNVTTQFRLVYGSPRVESYIVGKTIALPDIFAGKRIYGNPHTGYKCVIQGTRLSQTEETGHRATILRKHAPEDQSSADIHLDDFCVHHMPSVATTFPRTNTTFVFCPVRSAFKAHQGSLRFQTTVSNLLPATLTPTPYPPNYNHTPYFTPEDVIIISTTPAFTNLGDPYHGMIDHGELYLALAITMIVLCSILIVVGVLFVLRYRIHHILRERRRAKREALLANTHS